ncbi:MAG: LamG-like jellyroll fold domain-containing protein [Planctomycetota bacterium]
MARMQRFDWNRIHRKPLRPIRRSPASYDRRLRIEELEDRRVLAPVANISFSTDEIFEEEIVFGSGFEDAIQLDGVDDRVRLNAAEAAFDTMTNALTIEAWFRVDTFDGTNQTILSKGNDLWEITRNGTGNSLRFQVESGVVVTGSTNVNDGNWHHVRGTINDNGFASRVELYIDGNLEAFQTINNGGLSTNNANAVIGGNSQIGGRNFAGAIDEVRIWNVDASQVPRREATLSGAEPGLVAYYQFDDGTATDQTGGGGDGVLLGGPTFVDSVRPAITGFVDVQLSEPVTDQPGIILNYTLGGTATQGVDYYSSQLDIATTDANPPTNSIFIAEGESSARISVAALSDAVDEASETVTITLDTSQNPFGLPGPTERYTLGGQTTATINLRDSELFDFGILGANVFGESAVVEGLSLNPSGAATLRVKLASQPTANVTLNVGETVGSGVLSTGSLLFTPSNWDQTQEVTISDLAGLITDDGVRNFLGSVTLTAVSADPTYDPLFTSYGVFDSALNVKLNVDEGAVAQPITPIVGVRRAADAAEGEIEPGVFTISSDVAAPAGGLRVFYAITTGSGSIGSQFNVIDEAGMNSGFVDIPAGEVSATVLIDAIDDAVDDGTALVGIDIVANAAYSIDGGFASAQLDVLDNDPAAIETSTLTNLASLDTDFETLIEVDELFALDVTSFTRTANGYTATVSVGLTADPGAAVTLTLDDANSAATGQLSFGVGDAGPKSLTLDLVEGVDGSLRLDLSTNANASASYNGLSAALPFRRFAAEFDSETFLSTSEDGDDFLFGVRLSSEPTAAVAVTLSSTDASEGQLNTVLNFDNTNWDQYQVVTVVAQDDLFDDGEVEYSIDIDAASTDLNYSGQTADFDLVNEDNETDEDPIFDASDDSPILAGITPLLENPEEGFADGQFQITLSAPAPVGGLVVDYAIFEGSATFDDIDVPEFIERFGDNNPLATTQVESSDTIIGARGLGMADFDNDGDVDALLAIGGAEARFLENVGTPEIPEFVENFAANPLLGVGGNGISVADINGDGDIDVIRQAGNSIRYFENQFVGSGVLSFLEITGPASPFDGLVLTDAFDPALVDIDDDGQLELFITRNNPVLDFFEFNSGSGSYVAAPGSNPLSGATIGFDDKIYFFDIDRDGDVEAFIGRGSTIDYYENVGTAQSAQFVQRTGALDPLDGITSAEPIIAFADIDNNDDVDLFVTNNISLGEVESLTEVRYFEAAFTQQALIPEGQTSLIVDIPVVDDDIDENAESLDIAIVSRLTQSYNIEATSAFDDQFDLVVTQAFNGSNLRVEVDPATVDNITGSSLAAGTVLEFSGGARATLDLDSGLIEPVNGPALIFVTLDPMFPQTIGLGERATATFDSDIRITSTIDFNGSTVGLRIDGEEVVDSLLLTSGTVLPFFGGATATVTEDTVINVFTTTQVPVTVPIGQDLFAFDFTDIVAPPGEVSLVVDEADAGTLALAAGTRLLFSNGSLFEVSRSELLTNKLPGDADGNGTVDAADKAVWEAQFGSTGPGFSADFDFDGDVDIADLMALQRGFGQSDPDAGGVPVAGTIISGGPIPAGATATLVEPGYRVRAELDVTSPLAGGSVGLQIDETAYSSFTIPAGTVLEFGGGAIATVVSDILINNSSGTSVPVTLAANTGSQSIGLGEETSVSDFFESVDLVVDSLFGLDDGFLFLDIATPGVSTYTLVAGTTLVFPDATNGDIVVTVDLTTVINAGSPIDVQVSESFTTPRPLDDIMLGEIAEVTSFEFASRDTITINDNDTAGIALTPDGPAETTEAAGAGNTQTVQVVLQSEPKDNVFVFLGTDGTEALLSDSDETDLASIELLFTPENWNVAQQVTVRGVDDNVDDGDVQYAIRTTVRSTDLEYTDDTVEIRPVIQTDHSIGLGIPLILDELLIGDTLVPDETVLTFNSGAVFELVSDAPLTNTTATGVSGIKSGSIDRIGTNRVGVVNDGDELTVLEVTSDFAGGTVGLRLDSGQSSVLAATLLAGKHLRFSNGAEAVVTADATLNNTAGVLVSVTLTGDPVTTAHTSLFEENVRVDTAYDSGTTEIGLRVEDPSIGAIAFAAGTEFEFSNGALATLPGLTVLNNSDETSVAVNLNPNIMTTKASAFYTERLVEDLVFTSIDDDGAGVRVTQTDETIAVTEGFSNNLFTVVLESEPTAPVFVTLDPSDENLRLRDEFMGEAITIEFDATNWDVPQTIQVSAVDDSVLEYDHMSTVVISVVSADLGFDGFAVNPIEVFINDDEVPSANVIAVAGAIEANAPGYFVIELDTPAPTGFGQTGIEVSYSLGGTADSDPLGVNTQDVQPISGTALIAPGETRSPLIAFPIDDFKAEGVDLTVTSVFTSPSDGTSSPINLQIDEQPFTVGAGGYNSGTVELTLTGSIPDPGAGETTVLGQGTTLFFASTGTTVLVTETVIVSETGVTEVKVDADPGAIGVGTNVFQQIPLPAGSELRFSGGDVLTTTAAATLTNQNATAVQAAAAVGTTVSIAASTATRLQGDSLTVSIDPGPGYGLGAQSTAGISILDNDKPGVRILQVGDATTVAEDEDGAQFLISLLSEPVSNVDIGVSTNPTDLTIGVGAAYTSADTTVALQIQETGVDSVLLPAGVYTFTGGTITLASDTVVFSGKETSVAATVTGTIGASDTAMYSYEELSLDDTLLSFTPTNWFQLQPITVSALDDLVVEFGEIHFSDLSFGVASTDPDYNLFTVPDLSIEVIDRRFDKENTSNAIAQGFLALQDSIESVDLPVLGDFGDVAPSFIMEFLGGVIEEIRSADSVTAETLREAFNTGINTVLDVETLTVEVTNIATDELGFLLTLADTLTEDVPLNSDLGLEALNIGIETQGDIELTVDYGLSLGFGINATDGFFIDTDATAFEVSSSVVLSEGFSATGELGFLQLDITNALAPVNVSVAVDFDELNDVEIQLQIDDAGIDSFTLEAGTVIEFDGGSQVTVDEDTDIVNTGATAVAVSGGTGPVLTGETSVVGDPEGTMLDAAFVVTLEDAVDQRLTLSELTSNRGGSPFDFISYGFSGNAVLDLDVATSVAGNAAFPTFSFNLFSDLPLLNYGNEDEAGSDEEPTLTVSAGIAGVAAGQAANLTLDAGVIASGNARLTKGTELVFGNDRLRVDKTTTIASEGSAVVPVRVVGPAAATIGVGEAVTLESGAFNIAFNDITLDLGGFVSDLLGPIITSINDVVEPFRPIIDVLSSEVELLSKIGLAGVFDQDDDGSATLVEVALTLAGGLNNGDTAARFTRFVDSVTGVIELTESLSALQASIAAGESIAINFGSYQLQNFKGGSSAEDASTVDAETAGVATDPAMAPEDQTMATGNNRVSNFFGKLDDLGISLDVIENPLNVIKVFLGQDIDLVTWDVPELDLSFSIERTFPVFAGIRGVLQGDFNVYSDLVFGFDTFGLSRWKEEDFAVEEAYLIFDGFYLSDVDPDTGEDVDELTLEATIAAGVEANAVVAKIRGTGGITGTAALDLVDGGEYSGEADGRIRGSEIIAGLRRPLELFELAGSVEAFLNIVVSVGIDLGFWSIEKTVFERELARVTLFEFEIGGGGGGGSPVSAVVADTGVPQAALSSDPVQPAGAPVEAPAQAPTESVEPVTLLAAEPAASDTPLVSSDAWIAFIEGPADGRLVVPPAGGTPAVDDTDGEQALAAALDFGLVVGVAADDYVIGEDTDSEEPMGELDAVDAALRAFDEEDALLV